MTGHECPHCHGWVECDKRRMGTGRLKPLTGYTSNHKAVHEQLAVAPFRYFIPTDIRASLNFKKIARKGKRTLWYDADVQTLLSDLVGWGYGLLGNPEGFDRQPHAGHEQGDELGDKQRRR